MSNKQRSKRYKKVDSVRLESKRFCLVCKKMNKFKYNRNRLHSECVDCGSMFCTREPPEDIELAIKNFKETKLGL